MANISNNQKVLYPHIPKIDQSIPYPFKYLQKYPVSLENFSPEYWGVYSLWAWNRKQCWGVYFDSLVCAENKQENFHDFVKMTAPFLQLYIPIVIVCTAFITEVCTFLP